jgi:hypothetical protein
MLKPELLYLCDDISYIKQNCFQSQLFSILEQNFDLKIYQLNDIKSISLNKKFQYAISCLKLRTLFTHRSSIKKFLNNQEIFIYDQDAWSNYLDNQPYKNSYSTISTEINVKSFLNTSEWWADLGKSKGLPCQFVRMGILPEYCRAISWEKRNIEFLFQGTLHPHRKTFFEELKKFKIDVTVMPSTSYNFYLHNIRNSKIYIHNESLFSDWIVDGVLLEKKNALWIKDIEVASQGCYAIRDYEDESAAYNIKEIPLIKTFSNLVEIVDVINEIQQKDKATREIEIIQSIETIKQRNDWMTIVNAILKQ